MLVVDIEKMGRHKLRISMADGESFVLSEREWQSFDVKVGEELDDLEVQKIYQEYLLPKSKLKALNLLKVRDRSRQELIQKLTTDGYPEMIIQNTLDYVDGYHYLDDLRFARNYLDYKGGQKSCRELIYELRAKGIDLKEIQMSEEELEMPDDRETIQKLLLKRWGENPAPDMKEKERMMRYLARRGFRGGDVLSVYRNLGI